jgi:ornithine cyclodeaminase/alanine dehydrogenase-like protein (mu-crystallin family)
MQEMDAATVTAALVVVDDTQACAEEAGELIANRARIHAEIGEIVIGRKPGRTGRDQITLFKSVGLALQDAAMAAEVLKQAEAMGLGRDVDLS